MAGGGFARLAHGASRHSPRDSPCGSQGQMGGVILIAVTGKEAGGNASLRRCILMHHPANCKPANQESEPAVDTERHQDCDLFSTRFQCFLCSS